MPVRGIIRKHGFREAKRYLGGTKLRSRIFIRTLSPRILDHLREIVEGYFQGEAGPQGPWLPLAPFTIAQKGHDRILIETTRLYVSLVNRSPDSIVEVDNLHLGYGTRVPYAASHILGYQGGADVPRRNYWPPVNTFAPQIQRWAADYILGLNRSDVQGIELRR